MADPTPTITPPARLSLGGHDPAPARVEVVFRPSSLRLRRAALSLGAFWVLIPIVFFIPPHLPWVLIAFGLGVYFAYSNWSGTHEVRSFEAGCPRCGKGLEIKPGSRIRPPHKLVCYACHHQPRLELGRH